jgi:hypothetical protein
MPNFSTYNDILGKYLKVVSISGNNAILTWEDSNASSNNFLEKNYSYGENYYYSPSGNIFQI